MSSQLNIDVLGTVGSWQKAVGKNKKIKISSKIVKTGNMAGSFRDLTVYKKTYVLAMEIFEITKRNPSEEKYELAGQTRRSSRSGYWAIGEGKYHNIANCFLPTARPDDSGRTGQFKVCDIVHLT